MNIRLKLYVARNERTKSDYVLEEDGIRGGNHSAAMVILAEDKEEAMALVVGRKGSNPKIFLEELRMETSGIVVYADGEC